MGHSTQLPYLEFGKRLRALRLQAGITTQRELADRLAGTGIVYEYTYVSHWETGRRCPSLETLVALIQVLVEAGSIQTVEEADDLLHLAGVRNLDRDEITRIFGDPSSPASLEPPIPAAQDRTGPSFHRSHLPGKLYVHFVGRESILGGCLEVLRDPRAFDTIGIEGLGGIGKTALARELAERALDGRGFQAVYWITAKRTTLEPGDVKTEPGREIVYESILSEIAGWLGIQAEAEDVQEQAQKEKRVQETLRVFPCLFVLDNLETADEDQNSIAARLRKLLGPSKAILTSREKWDPTVDLYTVHLRGLNEDESVGLMKSVAEARGLDRLQRATYEQLAPLARIVGGAPLALKLTVGLLSTQDASILKTALEAVETQPISQMYRYLFLRSWRQLDDSARRLLFAVAQFSQSAGASVADLISTGGLEELAFADAIDRLTRLSLVEVAGDIEHTRYFLHPLTLNFLRSDLLKR